MPDISGGSARSQSPFRGPAKLRGSGGQAREEEYILGFTVPSQGILEPASFASGRVFNMLFQVALCASAPSSDEFTSLSRYNWAPAMTVLPIFALEAPPSLGEGGAHLNLKTVSN